MRIGIEPHDGIPSDTGTPSSSAARQINVRSSATQEDDADSGEPLSLFIVHSPRPAEIGQLRKALQAFIPDMHLNYRLADGIERGARASNDDLNAEPALIQESMHISPDARTVPLLAKCR
jgi:hypothetical protein